MEELLAEWGLDGIVNSTAVEMADRARSRPSRSELMPPGQCGRPVLFEDFTAVEMAVLVEMVVDRGMDGGELLESLNVPELGHRVLSSSERLV